ncbi:unnamed protein product [Urochloa decumbens]|uniref:TF-B3 domain-containing protein n=1 Tax=Urochloa decumbens TaxID=240449 RepID=A0ABC8WAC5_9POAL
MHGAIPNSQNFPRDEQDSAGDKLIIVIYLYKATPLVNIQEGRPASPRKLTLGKCNESMMDVEKRCDSCRKWQEHYYWEHMDVTMIRFFKLMTGDFTLGIIIPEKFVRNFNGKITEGVDLKAESGETWHVGVEKRDNELLLTSGWKDFVKAHELKENDLLIFTCSGNSSFDILIFEASGCEKLSSLFANRAGPNLHKHLNNTKGQNAEPYPLTDSEEASMPPQLVGFTHIASTSKKYNCKTKPRKEPQFLNSSCCHKSHRQRNNNFMVIPSRFAVAHLQGRTQEIILSRPSRNGKWRVRYYYTSYTRGFQNLQFFRFVHDNKLREGDICVFELMKGAKRVTMAVHVIRKLGDRFVLVR